jgi:phage anti-repressor protein
MKQLIANDLMPIYQTTDTGEKVVDARELCGFLNVGRDFSTWLKDRIEKYGFIEGEDFSPVLGKTSNSGGRPTKEYILKLDMAKELAMVENNEQGRKARKYFIEIERRFREGVTSQVPVDNMEHEKLTKLLQMLKDAERQRLFSPKLDRAFREEIASLVLGESKATHQIDEQLKYADAPVAFLNAPQAFVSQTAPYHEKWYLTSEIADMAGVSVQMVAAMSSKHGLRSDEYSRAVKVEAEKLSGLVRVMYNEVAKDKLLELLKGRTSRKKVKRK